MENISKLTAPLYTGDLRGFKIELPSLEAFIFSGAGLVLLFIGSWFPTVRLNIAGVQVDTIFLIAASLLATLSTVKTEVLKYLCLLQIPLLLLALSIFWSPLPLKGIDNLTSLVVTAFLAFLLFNNVIERYGQVELGKTLLIYLTVNLFAALIYKSIFGFWDRQELFFLNGPIIFARFMMIALVLSLFTLKGRVRRIASLVFFLAILWTESKGPILAATITLCWGTYYLADKATKKRIILGLIALLFLIILILNQLDISSKDIGRLYVLIAILVGDFSVLTESGAGPYNILGRVDLWLKSMELIITHPLGVGLGGWEYYVKIINYTKQVPYAHNLFLELWSEGGVVLGTFAALPLVVFLLVRKSLFWFVAFSLFLAQMVSGNLGDARQMYVFALLACLSVPYITNQNRSDKQ